MNHRKWIVAHRGEHSRVPQNTMAAFRQALIAGADMIEFDVRRLSDGELVVWHDDEIGGVEVHRLNRRTFKEFAASAGIPMLRLAEVLQFFDGRLLMDIELKDFGCEADVLRTLNAVHMKPENCVLTSFDAEQLRRIRQSGGTIRTGLLTESHDLLQASQLREHAAADYLAPDVKLLDDYAMDTLHGMKIPLLPWTVNSAKDLSRLLRAPIVAGVITDRVATALVLREGDR